MSAVAVLAVTGSARTASADRCAIAPALIAGLLPLASSYCVGILWNHGRDDDEADEAANVERQKIQAQYNAAQKELTAAEAVRAAAVAAVPEDLFDHYERIAKRHGGISLAEIRGEGCGQCGVHIRPHVIQQLERPENEEFFHCETCTRILYYSDHTAAKTAAPAAVPATEIPAAPTHEG